MIRTTFSALLMAGVVAAVGDNAAAQQGNNRNSAEDGARRSAAQQSEADESWEEWFSDWWSDDDESRRISGDQANSGKWGMRGFMRRHDENEDGHLSRDEFPERLQSGFDALDRNDDGEVSQAELQAHAERMASHRHTPVSVTYIWVMDTDQGRASLQELQQAYDVLQKVDQDEDGNITRNELRQRQRETASQWVDHCFRKLDDNDDGEISNSEAKGSALAQRFERLDKNDDDVLTRNELQAAAMPASRGSQEVQSATNRNQKKTQARPASLNRSSSEQDSE